MDPNAEIVLQGAVVSEGIAIGSPFILFSSDEEEIPEFPITVSEVDEEIARYRRALFSSREDLQKLQSDLVTEGSHDASCILDAHIQMLDDPLITVHMEERIRQSLHNTESVFRSVINEYETRFSKNCDSFFQQRLIDVTDVSQRILGHLSHKTPSELADIPVNSVIFAKELVPSYTAAAKASRISAFVTQTGGGNSHAALIARSKGIPYVAGVDLHHLCQVRGKYVIVDGIEGLVILNPTPSTIERYKKLQNKLKKSYQLLLEEGPLTSETIDGFQVHLYANVGSLADLDTLHAVGAKGIGLFRSEYLFLQGVAHLPTEEEQLQTYLDLLQKMNGLPVVIRAFDIGGDKNLYFFPEFAGEANPAMGCRGIRLLLRKKDLFKSQLRAVLRASCHGDLRLLLPLVSDIQEVLEAKSLLQEAKEELSSESIPYNAHLLLGSMIEVPSAVVIGDLIAKECDFLSIGTNDLVQYTLGIDRSNLAMSDFCYPAHPSIIRMIQLIALECRRQNKPVAICGEIASNPLFTPLLLGLGIEEFSCAPRFIPIIAKAIRASSLLDCCELATKVLQSENAQEVKELLFEEKKRREAFFDEISL